MLDGATWLQRTASLPCRTACAARDNLHTYDKNSESIKLFQIKIFIDNQRSIKFRKLQNKKFCWASLQVKNFLLSQKWRIRRFIKTFSNTPKRIKQLGTKADINGRSKIPALHNLFDFENVKRLKFKPYCLGYLAGDEIEADFHFLHAFVATTLGPPISL